ncbi:MAG: aminodeoxychorismate/anthranilate synthase component II [Desulfobulbaceae bacterium]|jgi:anthranilate synthase/aminodeoxychorismate synthase-like glutamine amidotransferase|nr:aminodeoxychorismate/anthranilate synthase component II [Desulfobulbaceae bacterium]
MYLIVDNYDSFVYNLAVYFYELGQDVEIKRNDVITIKDVEKGKYKAIIISPGPKDPVAAGNTLAIIQHFSGKIPIFGVCLGHQAIGLAFKARITKGLCPMHGKLSLIQHCGSGIFKGLPQNIKVTRYHSLVINEQSLPAELQIDARADDGALMAISHRYYPIYGVQFHPEAVLTEFGHDLLQNFITIAHDWQDRRAKQGELSCK